MTDAHRERAFDFPGTSALIRACDQGLASMGPRLLSIDPAVRLPANLDWASISELRATFHEGVGQPARAAADRRAARVHIGAALTIGRQVDLPRALAATCHAWQASLLATDGNWRGADAQLDRGYLLTHEAVEAGELTEANGSRIGWMMGQQVAEVAIDSERPAMALRRLDTIRSLFGDPPSGWRPHSELARFAAEAGAGKLPPEAIRARADGIAERFGVATPRRAWWVGATHLLAASHLLARVRGDEPRYPWTMRTGRSTWERAGSRAIRLWSEASPGVGPPGRLPRTGPAEGDDRDQERTGRGRGGGSGQAGRYLAPGGDARAVPAAGLDGLSRR